MHPDLTDLLNVRDGLDPAGPAAQHLAGCAACRAELERLQHVRAAMRSMPAPAPVGADAWSEIAARLEGDVRARPWPRPGWKFAGGLAAVLAIAIGLGLFRGSVPPVSVANSPADANQPAAGVAHAEAITALMAESQRLESLLAAIPEEPRVVRAATVMTAASLEDRIEWVDLALDAGEAREIDASAVAPLWRQRVDLLNSLVAVRYSQVSTASY